MKKNKKDEVENTKFKWGINCDGYYPYCTNCYYEPDRTYTIEHGLPGICPNCGVKLSNYKHLNKLVGLK